MKVCPERQVLPVKKVWSEREAWPIKQIVFPVHLHKEAGLRRIISQDRWPLPLFQVTQPSVCLFDGVRDYEVYDDVTTSIRRCNTTMCSGHQVMTSLPVSLLSRKSSTFTLLTNFSPHSKARPPHTLARRVR